MKKVGKRGSRTIEQLDRDLTEALRRRGSMIPITVEQVKATERLYKNPTSGSLPDLGALRNRLREVMSGTESAQNENRARSNYWTNSSVLAIAGDLDPVGVVTNRVRDLIMRAMEEGWAGPPYDPFLLAELLKIHLVPSQSVVDSRLTSKATGTYVLEYNPNRPPARIRYSIAHEISHTLFPDCANAVRFRGTHEGQDAPKDNWQLESLCNYAASEILMPFGSLTVDPESHVTMEKVSELRKVFQVSSEAVLNRLTRLTKLPCMAFAARRNAAGRYAVDYAVPSRAWSKSVVSGFLLPKNSMASACTAIGYTSPVQQESWIGSASWQLEYLGIPPYPGEAYPRVLGVATSLTDFRQTQAGITFLRRNATEPFGSGPRIIVQLVNDKARSWGGGFSKAVRQRWPDAQRLFTEWVDGQRSEFHLGAVHVCKLESSIFLASMVAQHGYGPSAKPRIRYNALATALEKVAAYAQGLEASVHMPRIGTGLARGSWNVVCDIIDAVVCRKGIPVTVYDLPNAPTPSLPAQGSLLF